MNVNDFLVSLGFDTKKIESQIKGVEKKLEKMAASVGIKASAQKIKQVRETAEKSGKIELAQAEKLIATKERMQKAAEKRERDRADKNNSWAMRRKQAVQNLVSKTSNPQLKAMSSYYRNLEKASTSSYSEKLKGDALKSRASNLADYVTNRASGRGMDTPITEAFSKQIIASKTIVDANRYARILDNISMRVDALDSKGKKELLRIVSTGQIDQLQRFNAELANTHRQLGRAKYQAFSLANTQDALRSSTRNLVREFASLYAALAGINYIKNQNRTLEGAAASMNAVSANSQEAADNMEFMRQAALKNGLSIGDATKNFVKMKAAIGDKLTLEETKEVFTDLTKASVVFQLTMEEQNRVIKSVQQMFSKSGIMAEELKNQMGDVLPTAMIALEKATGKTSKELMKMMEMGQLGAEYIKPFTEAIGDLAMANGAYDKALKTLGKTEDRFFTNLQDYAGVIGKSGFNEGLVSLYQGLIETLQGSQHTLKELGKVFNVFFRAIKKGIDLITPLLNGLIRVFGTFSRVLEYFAQNPLKAAELGIYGLIAGIGLLIAKTGGIKAFGEAIGKAFMKPWLMVTAIITLLDEIRAYFDADVIGIFDDPNMSKSDRDAQALERKKSGFIGSLLGLGASTEQQKNIPTAVAWGAAAREKLGGGIAGSAADATIRANIGFLEEYAGYAKILATTNPFSSGQTVNVTLPVMIDGKEISRKVMTDVTNQQKAAMATSMPAGGQ